MRKAILNVKFADVKEDKKFWQFPMLVRIQGQRTIIHIIEYLLGESKRK